MWHEVHKSPKGKQKQSVISRLCVHVAVFIWTIVSIMMPVCAQEQSRDSALAYNVIPQMELIYSTDVDINVDTDGRATISCRAYSNAKLTNRLEATVALQRYVNERWVTIKIFGSQADSHILSFNESCFLTSGYLYRAQATISAYNDLTVETYKAISDPVAYRIID